MRIDFFCPPDCRLIATLSEVSIAAEAVLALNAEGRRVRLVSMPSAEVFEAQDAEYREYVLPQAVRCRVAVEAGASLCWWRYVGLDGRVLGLDHFGASGRGPQVMRHFGFTAARIREALEALLEAPERLAAHA